MTRPSDVIRLAYQRGQSPDHGCNTAAPAEGAWEAAIGGLGLAVVLQTKRALDGTRGARCHVRYILNVAEMCQRATSCHLHRKLTRIDHKESEAQAIITRGMEVAHMPQSTEHPLQFGGTMGPIYNHHVI